MREGFLYIIWFIVWSMVLLISVFGLFFMHKSNLLWITLLISWFMSLKMVAKYVRIKRT